VFLDQHCSHSLTLLPPQLRFHKRYEAVVIAVHRKDKAISSSIGDIELRAGDGLLLEAAPKFFERHRYDRDFGLLSIIEGSGSVLPPHKPYHALLAAAGVLFIAVSSATNFLSLSESTLCVCIAFHLTGTMASRFPPLPVLTMTTNSRHRVRFVDHQAVHLGNQHAHASGDGICNWRGQSNNRNQRGTGGVGQPH